MAGAARARRPSRLSQRRVAMNLAEQYARITQMMVASQAEFCARNELIEARYLAAIRGETLPEDTPENEEPDENDKSNAGTPAAGDGASTDQESGADQPTA